MPSGALIFGSEVKSRRAESYSWGPERIHFSALPAEPYCSACAVHCQPDPFWF